MGRNVSTVSLAARPRLGFRARTVDCVSVAETSSFSLDFSGRPKTVYNRGFGVGFKKPEKRDFCLFVVVVFTPRVTMPLRVLLLLLLVWPVGPGRVRKKATRARACQDLPEEVLEQMFGRLSVGVMSAFHHALQLEPHDKLNLTCPSTGRTPGDRKSRLPVNLLSISPWAYR